MAGGQEAAASASCRGGDAMNYRIPGSRTVHDFPECIGGAVQRQQHLETTDHEVTCIRCKARVRAQRKRVEEHGAHASV